MIGLFIATELWRLNLDKDLMMFMVIIPNDISVKTLKSYFLIYIIWGTSYLTLWHYKNYTSILYISGTNSSIGSRAERERTSKAPSSVSQNKESVTQHRISTAYVPVCRNRSRHVHDSRRDADCPCLCSWFLFLSLGSNHTWFLPRFMFFVCISTSTYL